MTFKTLFPSHQPSFHDINKGRIRSLGEKRSQFKALLQKPLLGPRTRGYIQLKGPDRIRFLQGQVTCDMEKVTTSHVINGAHCTPKGRVIFVFSAHAGDNDDVILDVHSSVTALAIASLKKYAVFFKLEINDLSADLDTFILAGPHTGTIVKPLCDQPLPEKQARIVEPIFALQTHGVDHLSITCKPEDSASVVKKLEGLVTPVGEELTDLLILRTGFADITEATTDTYIPQMLNLDHQGFISFSKGCYTGQEIVARAHYRGAVKRRMQHLSCPLSTLPLPGTPINNAQGKSLGSVASAAWVDESHVELLAVLADTLTDYADLQMGDSANICARRLDLNDSNSDSAGAS